MDLRELKEWIAYTRPDLPGPEILKVLVGQYRGPGTLYSPSKIAEHVGREREQDVLAALLVLSTHHPDILRGQWLYHDDDGEDFPISPDEVAEIVETREFFHPLTGDPVYDYEQSIGLVYETGPDFPVPEPGSTDTTLTAAQG